MVTIHQSRLKDGMVFDTPSRSVTEDEAFERLMVYELGYGGYPSEVTPTKIAFTTSFMGCLDTTVFEGSESDLSLMVKACELFQQAKELSTDAAVDKVMRLTGGNPRLVTLAGSMLAGTVTLRAILFLLLCKDERIEYHMPQFTRSKTKELCTMIPSFYRGEYTLEEVLELTA